MIPNNLLCGFVPGSRAHMGGMGGRQWGFMGFLPCWAFLLSPPFHSSKLLPYSNPKLPCTLRARFLPPKVTFHVFPR